MDCLWEDGLYVVGEGVEGGVVGVVQGAAGGEGEVGALVVGGVGGGR